MFNKLTSWENQMIDNKKVIVVFYSLISSLPPKCFCFHHHLLFHFLLFQRKYRRLLMRISEQQHSIVHLFLDSGRPATELLRPSSVLLKNGLQSLPFSPRHPYAPEQGDLLNKGVTLQLFALPKMIKIGTKKKNYISLYFIMEVHITHVFQQQTSDSKIPSLQKQLSLLPL